MMNYHSSTTNTESTTSAPFSELIDLSDLELRDGHMASAVQAGGLSPTEQDSTSSSANLDTPSFSVQLLHRFERSGNLADLQQAISILEASIGTTPHGDHRYLVELVDLAGVALQYRFGHVGELGDLEEAILRHRHAVDLSANSHPDKPRFLSHLGGSLETRFERLGELTDLEEAISRQKKAVDFVPDGHPDKPVFLDALGKSLGIRFRRLGEQSDLEEANLKQRNSVGLMPDGHPHKPGCLHNLGNSLTRFNRFGELCDLEEAISMQRDAVDLIPHGHPSKSRMLTDLGNSLETRFKRCGELSNLEESILKSREAVDLTPHGHPDIPGFLNGLGSSLLARFQLLGPLNDLEEAVLRLQSSVDLTPDDHPNKPVHLNNLGNSLLTRFQRLGDTSDLEKAILMYQHTVNLTSDDHPDKPGLLNGLGSSLFARFQLLGDASDLEESILKLQNSVDLTPDDHPYKPGFLNNLGNDLKARYECLGEPSDLEEGVSRQQNSVDLIPDSHPHKPGCLHDLGNSFFIRFKRFGELHDLEEAISSQKNAVILTPHDHSVRPRYLSVLGNSLLTRHPHEPELLHNLGNSLEIRFQHLGELSDIEEAISRQKKSVYFTPDGDPFQPGRLNNLSDAFLTRFQRLGEITDLNEAISRQRDAVNLTPDDNPHKPGFLGNLGNSLVTRFGRLGELRDLEEGISRQRDAVNLIPDSDPHKPRGLNNLGISLLTRFDHFGELGDLEEAISRQRNAVELTPHSHLEKPRHLYNLGNSLYTRFERLGELRDLEEAISRRQNSAELTPDYHPYKPMYLYSLGDSFFARCKRLGGVGDLERAISLYSAAARASAGPIDFRFRASLRWIHCARFMRHDTLLHAYSVAILLLPQLPWIGLSLAHRYGELSQGANVAREAAAAALDSGRPETAVEWLEQGRSIVWGELLQLRSSCDELSSVHPDHASRLRELSTALEDASATREKSLSERSEHVDASEHRGTEVLQQEADNHRMLAIERDRLLQDIRRLPGFERFLLHKQFSQFRGAARSGPAVILNAANTRCDALIVVANADHVIHVPLPKFTLKRANDLQAFVVRHARAVIPRDDRYGRPISQEDGNQWKSILAPLWKCVVKPVLAALDISTPGNLSRIFWCPTGPFTFLPIHAAGFYDHQHSQPGHKVFDFVILSYIPTLSILASSPEFKTASSNDLRLLVVPQPTSDGQSRLPGVVTELEHIRAVIKNSPLSRTVLTESSSGTVKEVLGLMKKADWVHFACHGIQDGANPTNSGLCLANERRLRVSDIITLSRPHGGLAFLSACQTAKGHEGLSDEAIHIAAGMLFAGYGGVVGTMWSISDKLAPNVAKDVYEQLFRDGTTPGYQEAARALHGAVGQLRESGVSFEDWLPFIHVGL